MSLLTICQDAAREIGFPIPLSIVSNTVDKSAQQLYAMANRTGNSMAKEKDWSRLVKEDTITLVTSTQEYALPADFKRIIPETMWNRTDRRKVDEPLTSQEWSYYKGWQTLAGLNLRARLRNNKLEFEQEIDASMNGEVIAFEYLSSYWAETAGGTAKAVFSLDDDVALLDEEIITLGVIYRFKKAKGLDWQTEYVDYQRELTTVKGFDGGSKKVNLGTKSYEGTPLGLVVPDRGYGS